MAASSSRNAACRVLQSSHLSGVSSRRAVFPSKELLAGVDCHRSFSTSHSVLAKDDGKTQARGKGKGRASNNVRDDIRFNFNTSLIFTEDPNPEVRSAIVCLCIVSLRENAETSISISPTSE